MTFRLTTPWTTNSLPSCVACTDSFLPADREDDARRSLAVLH